MNSTFQLDVRSYLSFILGALEPHRHVAVETLRCYYSDMSKESSSRDFFNVSTVLPYPGELAKTKPM